jgi:hypothetical protein
MIRLTFIAGMCALALVMAFGGYLLFLGSRNVQRALASRAWPTAAGTVRRADTARTATEDSDTGRQSVTYATNTVIAYTAGGREYSTNLIRFGQTLGSGDESEAELQRVRYPVGARVRVSYDPCALGIAALRPGFHSDALWLPGIGLAALLFGIAAFVWIVPAVARG